MEIVGSWSDTYGAKALAGIVDRIVERDYGGIVDSALRDERSKGKTSKI
jgi:hypothetical protein